MAFAGAKICGLTRLDQVQECARLGASWVGLNFWPKSKRYLSPDILRDWREDWPEGLTRVGVFVNPELPEVLSALDSGLIGVAQLHGEEPPEFCASLKRAGHAVWKAFGVEGQSSLEPISTYEVDALVLDAYCPGTYGGTGKQCDWALARKVVERFPERKVMLSGGLTPSNLAEAIARVQPWAVDVASGVEASPGVKDMALVAEFLTTAKASLR